MFKSKLKLIYIYNNNKSVNEIKILAIQSYNEIAVEKEKSIYFKLRKIYKPKLNFNR